jgi:2-oxo-4-hydroxy-4-carboxy-5-ureidoimidazoline decarboxylase
VHGLDATAAANAEPVGEPGVAWLDGLSAEAALRELTACCAARRWALRMTQRRPYRNWPALLDASVAALRELEWTDVLEALSAHPMIGRRADGESREAAWSREEQAGMEGAAAEVASRLAEQNVAYQEKFGHVFLICAAGLPAEVMLRALEHRLRNDAATEQLSTRAELAAITRLRLERLVAAGAQAATTQPATRPQAATTAPEAAA